jgi:valyl-tRNA synthetase
LATKLLNATKFVLTFPQPDVDATPTHPVDLAMLARVAETIREATVAFDQYDYARALERTEAMFWWFCDDYVELVKGRVYNSQGAEAAGSAISALRLALSALQRLLAPFMPFTTETVWRWWQSGSVHTATWPNTAELGPIGDSAILDPIGEILSQVRRAKTDAKTSQKTAVTEATVSASESVLAAFELGRGDLSDAGSVRSWVTVAGAGETTVSAVLAPPEPAS